MVAPRPLSKGAGLPNPKESDLDQHRTASLRTTPAFSSTVEHPQRIQRFLDGLCAPVLNAPSLYSWSAWRQTVTYLIEDEAHAVRMGRSPAVWHGPTLAWLADVAVLGAEAPYSPMAQAKRLRLAQTFLALYDDPSRATPHDRAASIVRHLAWIADHLDGWIQRDRGSVHTLKRLQDVAALLRRFAGTCLDTWMGTDESLRDPALLAAADRALNVSTTPWSAVGTVERTAGLPPAGLRPLVPLGSRQEGGDDNLIAKFARCWDAMGESVRRNHASLRQGLDLDDAPWAVVLPRAVAVGLEQEARARQAAEAQRVHDVLNGSVGQDEPAKPGQRSTRRPR